MEADGTKLRDAYTLVHSPTGSQESIQQRTQKLFNIQLKLFSQTAADREQAH